ncbi:MAG: hypothetical protein QOG20_5223 [Pseudonocardiales bacterium]|nr:hypothetical protein [Pseudonocardiales bacterium]
MANPRSSQGHTIVAVLVALTAVAHVALAVAPGAPPWITAVSALVALAAVALLVAGLSVQRYRFGGPEEDLWLVACAIVGMVGVACGLVLAVVSVAGRGGVDPWGIGALLVDALAVRLAVFTLRRVPAGR